MRDPVTGDNSEIYTDIVAERHAQHAKFGGGPGDVSNPAADNGFRLGVLGEEFGEVAKAFIEDEPVENLRAELVQVAAVCIAWIAGLDANA